MIHLNVKRQYVVAPLGEIRLKFKVLFFCCCFSPWGVPYGGKMIEFLCKVEFPASPRTSRVPVRQNQVWQNVPLESPFEKDFKYSSTAPAQHNLSLKSLLVGILQICHQSSRPAFRSNSPSECLQTPQVGLEIKSFYASCQIKWSLSEQ